VARSALLLLGLLLSLPAAAAEKVDLTAHLTAFPVLGDFKVDALSNGDVRREERTRGRSPPT
jgi:hypothetical protein